MLHGCSIVGAATVNSIYCCAKPKGSNYVFSSEQLLPFGFADRYNLYCTTLACAGLMLVHRLQRLLNITPA